MPSRSCARARWILPSRRCRHRRRRRSFTANRCWSMKRRIWCGAAPAGAQHLAASAAGAGLGDELYPESFDALLDAVFHRHGARLPRQRIIRAHSFGMLQALVESAEMCTRCPLPIAALPQFASACSRWRCEKRTTDAAEHRHPAQQHSERRRPCVYRHAGAHPALAGAIVAAGRSPDLRSRAPADLADLPGSTIRKWDRDPHL